MSDQAFPTKDDLDREVVAVLTAGDRPLTLDQVRERLSRAVMATTVMTVLSRLHEQGLVRRAWVGRAYVYTTSADRAELAADRIRVLLDTGGDRRAVLTRFIAMLPPDDERVLIDLLTGAPAETGR
ncbi:BlaI/MecI/CopY family transcriptional regulator [Planosporangium sp. 12N6]|uniref:BlaI/MecI/CopY family transcriptional regulator n=1 Tax=Planosporangium spinosum TaxID=3402278 RepID=UPI003CF48C6A